VSDNRRSSTRHVVDLAATLTVVAAPPSSTGGLTVGAVEECRLVNLAVGGAYIQGRRLPMGMRVRIAFAVPGYERIDAPATVRWGDIGGSGLQFDGLRAKETWALGKYIESL
jgi:hypothetical protein